MKNILISLVLLVAAAFSSEAQTTATNGAVWKPGSGQNPATFPSYMADKDAEPSADPASPFWRDVTNGVVIDRSVLGEPQPQFRCDVRSRWTKDYVYFLFFGPYEKLTLKPNPDTTNETYRLWEKDCFEVYLGADFVHTNLYREFQMSPQGEFLDLNIDSTKSRPGFNGEDKWNSGMKVKGRIDEKNKMIYGEFKIPITAVDTRPAQAGNEMRINLYRQDGEQPNRDFLGWQPPMIWNPHHPEVFGMLKLVNTNTAGK